MISTDDWLAESTDTWMLFDSIELLLDDWHEEEECHLDTNGEWPFGQTHKDLRSRSRTVSRERKQKQKYYGYRGVKPSWVGQQYYDIPDDKTKERCMFQQFQRVSDFFVATPDTAVIKTWTKTDTWQERNWNIWPLDWRHHLGKVAREGYQGWTERKLRVETRALQSATEGGRLLYQEVEDDLGYEWQLEDDEVHTHEPEAMIEPFASNCDWTDICHDEQIETDSAISFEMLNDDEPEDAVSDDGWGIVACPGFG